MQFVQDIEEQFQATGIRAAFIAVYGQRLFDEGMGAVPSKDNASKLTCVTAGRLIVNLIGSTIKAGYFDK
ncbi:MAG: hypothetical protein NVS3B5_18050 [Sphingomicrobium sp.]